MIHESAVFDGAIIGKNVRIDAFALVNKGVVIGDDCYIGPYTHVKAHLPPYTKALRDGSIGINYLGLRPFYSKETLAHMGRIYKALRDGHALTHNSEEYALKLIRFFKEYCERVI